MNKKNRKKLLKKIDEKANIKKIALEAVQQMQTMLPQQPAYAPNAEANAKAVANDIFNKVLEQTIEEMLNEVDQRKIMLD